MSGLDAEFLIAGPQGARTVKSADWMIGAFTTALEPEDMLTGVRIRKLSVTARWSYYKFNRKPGEFAEAIALVIDASAAALEPHLLDAGLEAGSYEYQVHRVALERAIAALRTHGRNPQ